MGWTKEQKMVIDSRDKNLLVSAAAGSGKTAVMVERIVSIISDEKRPVDIDRLLVVTFTNAAASEMKERIMNALEKKIQEDPVNQHLQRQITRVQKAQITTIHSFCLNLIREYFMKLNLDPGFRIGEEGEIGLLHQDAISELMEEAYEKKEEDFLAFLESYATGKNDKKIEDLILQAYTFARSGARPEKWLEDAAQAFCCCEEELYDQDWMKYLCKDISYDVEEILNCYRKIVEISMDAGIPEGHRNAVSEEYERVKIFADAKTFPEYIKAAAHWKKTSIRSRAGKQHDKEKIKQMMDLRKDAQDMIERLMDRKLPDDEQSMLRDMKQCEKPMRAFSNLVLRFMELVHEKKREKNLLDFSDLEQYALQILTDGYDEEGKAIPSQIAMEKKEYYLEIYVDEYQDTNDIQEEILCLISGDNNLFTVGDVKQSIYGFRQAKPELFIQRYYRYKEESQKHRLIELQKNFRSRKQVLNLTNYIFYRLMIRELGNISYDKNAALFPAMEFPDEQMDAASELHLLNLDHGCSNLTDVEAEAAMIGKRIEEMVNGETPQMVTCTKSDGTKALRKAEYKDIVILLRTVSGWGETIQAQLDHMGIPAFCESKKGSFSTIEVQMVMSLLKILDNEQQDIPFAAFLRAPFIGLTGDDMVWMTTSKKLEMGQACTLSEHMQYYMEHGENQRIIEKLQKADEFLREFRIKKQYLSIPDLIWEICNWTDYYHLIGAMPFGERRQANIRMLIQKAKQFENGSYKGLFYFVRYMEQLQEYDIDYGEANVQGEHENLVRIMSIHKSKGLEYPIVILAGASKAFNMMDTYHPILMHSQYHFGPDVIDLKRREKHAALQKKMIALKIREEILSEEMRILYVAMTRAKDKLLITGTVKKMREQLKKNHNRYHGNHCSYFDIKTAGSYMDWILMAIAYHPSIKPLYESYFPEEKVLYDEEDITGFKIIVTSLEGFDDWEAQRAERSDQKKQEVYDQIKNYSDESILKTLTRQIAWEYPYEADCRRKIKYSVSELKQRSQQNLEPEESIQPLKSKEESDVQIPAFMKKEGTISWVRRGVAVHKCMELLDFAKDYSEEDIKKQIRLWIQYGKIEAECEQVISTRQILWFLHSRIGRRAHRAAKNGNLYKERQFVLGIPLKEIDSDAKSEELAVVQGIIDLYFIEDEEIVLVDYKTDRIRRTEEEKLIEHYREQMVLYKKALEQMTGRKVKEIYITSMTLQKNICLKE